MLESDIAPCDGVSEDACSRWCRCPLRHLQMQRNLCSSYSPIQFFVQFKMNACVWMSVGNMYAFSSNLCRHLFGACDQNQSYKLHLRDPAPGFVRLEHRVCLHALPTFILSAEISVMLRQIMC